MAQCLECICNTEAGEGHFSLIRTPLLINFEENHDFTNASSYFLSFLLLFTPTFKSEMACFCIYFNFNALEQPAF